MMQRFVCRTKIIAGAGAVSTLSELGAKRVVMVTDPYFWENGTAERIGAQTRAENIQYFHKVAPDPSVALAAEGTAMVREAKPDLIIALGGGSAMDCAKAMAYFAGEKAKLAAIPTTSGSGSEVTDFAILTHEGVKHPLVDQRMQPDYAILDSDLLEKLPRQLIADGGFDVLSHALEGYVARNHGAISDSLAESAFQTAFALLPASYAGNTEVRMELHLASTMAGLSFTQAGLGVCHAISHTLGGMFHIPHGRLNGIFLPAVVEQNRHAAGERYARLARSAGISGTADTVAVRNLKNGLIRLRKELNMPGTLAEAGIDPRKVWSMEKEIVKSALADPCCATNPVTVEDYMVRRILEEVTGRV